MTVGTLEATGAGDRARGLSLFDNPLYNRAAMPSTAGESAAIWSQKAEAWTRGWQQEDARRLEETVGDCVSA